MKSRVAETFLKSVALGIPSHRMDYGNTNLLLSWVVIGEVGQVCAVDIDLEG